MLRVHLRRRQVVRSRRYAAIGIILLPSDQYTIVNTRPSVYDSMCTVVGVAVGICSLEYCNLYDRRYTAVGITTVVGLRPSVYIRCLRPSVYIHWYTAVGFMHDHCISRALRALIPMYHPYREYRYVRNKCSRHFLFSCRPPCPPHLNVEHCRLEGVVGRCEINAHACCAAVFCSRAGSSLKSGVWGCT
jgi:hypothetical protein